MEAELSALSRGLRSRCGCCDLSRNCGLGSLFLFVLRYEHDDQNDYTARQNQHGGRYDNDYPRELMIHLENGLAVIVVIVLVLVVLTVLCGFVGWLRLGLVYGLGLRFGFGGSGSGSGSGSTSARASANSASSSSAASSSVTFAALYAPSAS